MGPGASIGPRLFSRGKSFTGPSCDSLTTASIGPRLFSRGKPRSRNPLPIVVQLQLGRGFSAAESSRLDGVGGPWHASIGPRLFSRGKLDYGRSSPGRQHRFNWAAAFQPRKATDKVTVCRAFHGLQLGRGFSAAESSRLRRYLAVDGLASIGPRLFSRGKYVGWPGMLEDPLGFNWAAAFQPRKATGPHTTSDAWTRLQLGRGFSAAESCIFSLRVSIGWSLQLGRGFSAAERYSRFTPSVYAASFNWAAAFQPRKANRLSMSKTWALCFNWAAAFQPRKVVQYFIACHYPFVLQLGRGFSAAESVVTSVGSSRLIPSFNWAAAFQPRKVSARVHAVCLGTPLQLGRGFSAAERL